MAPTEASTRRMANPDNAACSYDPEVRLAQQWYYYSDEAGELLWFSGGHQASNYRFRQWKVALLKVLADRGADSYRLWNHIAAPRGPFYTPGRVSTAPTGYVRPENAAPARSRFIDDQAGHSSGSDGSFGMASSVGSSFLTDGSGERGSSLSSAGVGTLDATLLHRSDQNSVSSRPSSITSEDQPDDRQLMPPPRAVALPPRRLVCNNPRDRASSSSSESELSESAAGSVRPCPRLESSLSSLGSVNYALLSEIPIIFPLSVSLTYHDHIITYI